MIDVDVGPQGGGVKDDVPPLSADLRKEKW